MKSIVPLAGALVLGLATAATAAAADDYYVVRSPSTHHCTVTTTKPIDKEVVTQIGPLAFSTREEAEGRIKQTKVCEEGTTGSSTTVIKER